MYFKIIDGKPYYYNDGAVYEVKIDNGAITLGRMAKLEYDGALYTVPELVAKCKVLSSITSTSAREKKK